MHSSRMRTIHCSGCRGVGGVSQHALGRVGCVYPSMHFAGGWCLPRGYLPRGCLPREVFAQRVSAQGGRESAPVYAGIHPPVNRMTHVCQNITLRTVIIPLLLETDQETSSSITTSRSWPRRRPRLMTFTKR